MRLRDLAQPTVERLVPRRDHRRLELAHPAPQVVCRQRHHLTAEAVEERGVARLVHELRGEEQLHLAAGAACRNGARSAVTRSSPM